MEVKEVNNSAAQMFLNKIASNPSVEALGAGFASLLGQTSSALDLMPSASQGPDVAVKTTEKYDRPETPDKDKETPAVADDKASRPQKEKKAKTAERPDAAAAEQPAQQARPEENVRPVANEKTAPAAEAPVAEPATTEANNSDVLGLRPVEGEPVVKKMDIAMVNPADKTVAAVINDGAVTLLSDNIDLNALASMESVSVLDAATGEIKTMSGAELLEKVQTASSEGMLYVPGENDGAFVELLPVEVAEETAVKAEKNTVGRSALENIAYDNENLASQAAVLDEKAGEGRKLKVDVSVKEENFSYRSQADLVGDKISLDKAVKAAVAGDGDEASVPQVAQSSSAQPAFAAPLQGNAGGAGQVMTPAAAAFNISAAASAADDAAVVSGSVSSVSEIGSSAVNHAAAGNAGGAGALKTAVAEKTSDTSFRDIYKGMSKEIIDQVKVNITKSAVKGVDKIDISLKPEDLGHIEVKMQIAKDGKLQAHIISSRPETMEVLQKEIQNLEKAFNEAGFQTDEGSLSFSFREDNQAGRNQNEELRHFIGNVFENETETEIAGNDNLQNWSPARGLNIRV